MPFEMDSTISIHAPREGGDSEMATISGYLTDFNPRPPRGGRQRDGHHQRLFDGFQSTPPARGATGHYYCSECAETSNFNPRPPQGGRHASFEQSENA